MKEEEDATTVKEVDAVSVVEVTGKEYHEHATAEKMPKKNKRVLLYELTFLAMALVSVAAVAFSLGYCLSGRNNSSNGSSLEANLSNEAAQEAAANCSAIQVDATKTAWPELVGMPVEDAVLLIRCERPDVAVVVVDSDTYVTKNWDASRVFVVKCHQRETVSKAPQVG